MDNCHNGTCSLHLPSVLVWTAPFVLYLLLTKAISVASETCYPLLYTVCVLVTGSVTVYLMVTARPVRPHTRIIPGVMFGLIGIVLWIYLNRLGVEQTFYRLLPAWLLPDARVAFNPFEQIRDPAVRWLFILVRTAGLVLLVPLAEELFWRGWLMRWIISQEWEQVPVGKFTLGSFLGVTLLFTLAHPEWLAAAVWCVLINLLLYWRKDLWNCMVAHAVTNLCLVVYIMVFDVWSLW